MPVKLSPEVRAAWIAAIDEADGWKIKRPEIPSHHGTNFKHDNKEGMRICNMLMVKPLEDHERQFVSDIMMRIIDHPRRFGLTRKQWWWLRALCKKHLGLKVE